VAHQDAPPAFIQTSCREMPASCAACPSARLTPCPACMQQQHLPGVFGFIRLPSHMSDPLHGCS
jgi:hypothetical protein